MTTYRFVDEGGYRFVDEPEAKEPPKERGLVRAAARQLGLTARYGLVTP